MRALVGTVRGDGDVGWKLIAPAQMGSGLAWGKRNAVCSHKVRRRMGSSGLGTPGPRGAESVGR